MLTFIKVHMNWMQDLLDNGSLPQEFRRHEKMSDDECELFLQEQSDGENSDWKIIEITGLKKHEDGFSRYIE